MAELRKIARSNPVSAMQNVAPESGLGFRLAAKAMEEAYGRFRPAAIQKMQEAGEEEGRRAARMQMGEGRAVSVMGGAAGTSARFPNVSAGAAQAFSALESEWGEPLNVISSYRDPEHNARVGGARNSQHTHGNAFDIDVSNYTQEQRIDLIRRARAAGFRGVGVYDNTLHFDVGPDRAWGADYTRGSLPAWAAGAVSSPVGAASVTPAEVIIRTPEGKVEPRLYSPLSGEILQAHNAAAQVAYQSEVLNRAAVDLADLVAANPLDAEAFDEMSRDYIDQIVETAPREFAPGLRSALENEARRSYLGIVDAKHRDVRARAANESAALVDRWSQAYSDALASGNPDEIAVAEANLDSILIARESLPGVAWTRAQSENVWMKAQEGAERIRQQAAAEFASQTNDSLRLIANSANAGLTAADEWILTDPNVQAVNPELWREAAAAVAFRDALPSFYAQPPAAREAAIADLAAQPVSEDWQIDMVRAARNADSAVRAAWDEDAIATADAYMPETNKPPALADFDPANPQSFLQSLAARSRYVDDVLVQGGYIDAPVYLSQQEAEGLAVVLGRDSPPEVRAAVAGALVAGFGSAAPVAFAQIGSDDPVTRYGGMLMGRGGPSAVVTEAMRGQELLDQGVVQRIDNSLRISGLSAGIGTALAGIPGAERIEGDLMQFASAIYAARARGVDPSSQDAKAIWEQSVQAALGQTTTGNETRGGVQSIYRNDVLLPIGVSRGDVEDALRAAFNRAPHEGSGFVGEGLANFANMGAAFVTRPAPGEVWIEASKAEGYDGSLPYLAGEPLRWDLVKNGRVRFVPMGGNRYRMEYQNGDPITDANGALYSFDMMALVQAGR